MTATEASPALCRPATCKTCPFRGGFHLNYERRLEIHHAVMIDGHTFHCHSEVDYDTDDSEDEPSTYRARQCAGATSLVLREGGANQVMRWERTELAPDPAVPFDSWSAWVHEPEFSEGAPEADCLACGPGCEGHTCGIVASGCECPAGWGGSSGVTQNPERLSDPEWCSTCGEAMCSNCNSGKEDGPGYKLCVYCGEDLDDSDLDASRAITGGHP
ncbi:MAG: hypothetical protein ACRBK7_14425 [Acidimicrobiales bacterium]